MKKLSQYIMAAVAMIVAGMLFTACSDFDPRECPDVPALAKASDLQASISGRTVTLAWTLPQQQGITSVRVSCDNGNPIILPATATTCTMKGQPMGRELVYTVKVEYDNKYVSEGVSVATVVPHIDAKVAYVLTAATPADLPDDDERAAAAWFAQQPNTEFVKVSDIASLDPDIYSVLWIEIDRVGLPLGWTNLPGGLADDSTIAALREYSANGGAIYLSNMATQLTAPLGFVPEDMAPSLFGNGEGGDGSDVWVINPFLGVDFKNGSDQGYYDRSAHAIYQGITLEDPNNYGYLTVPLIGPGRREDHNCMWDCNIYGRGSERDVIAHFEKVTNSLVLATWGHVRDHCVAGLVEFFATESHGRCIANGFAAYEWNQNSGTNPYQHNVERLTLNILNYLK